MHRPPISVLAVLIFLVFPVASSVDEVTKQSMIQFIDKVSPGIDRGWSLSTDPCTDKWKGLNFSGTLDASPLCRVGSLAVLSLKGYNLVGGIPEEIANCKRLTHLYLGGNRFSGQLPDALSRLNNLKRVDVSDNNFTGPLPNLAQSSGMTTFFAQNNNFTGELPQFDFANFEQFNVSNNDFTAFSGTPGLCGSPLPNSCPPPQPAKKKQKDVSLEKILIYLGYMILGLIVLLFSVYKIARRSRKKADGVDGGKDRRADTSSSKTNGASSEPKTSNNRSEYSITSMESGMNTSSLVVLTNSPEMKDLKFEDLLRAPAELLGIGKHGSLYRVVLSNGLILVVKRIGDSGIPSKDFKNRMQKVDRAKHPNVLPPIAFYCSKQEKLLVYEYQPNGSLFNLLHGNRLSVAATIAEALAFMHSVLREDGIAHGYLKTTNILLDKDMGPCVSKYGLMVVESQDYSQISEIRSNPSAPHDAFKDDVYGLGLMLLELLTGNMVQNNGYDLAKWVQSVVREERTGEVFDSVLISEGADEERMVRLLQVALQCTNPPPAKRPSSSQAAALIGKIKDEDERPLLSDS
ncbi:hypothetical protein ACJRO7_008474 [Eucalyptus globulus]|uniref:Protein kinase domain-containing protein n=1 Tax=Eucalyptus globulus TaxID=34317 RepID=A0ABD3IRV0_EUCGL